MDLVATEVDPLRAPPPDDWDGFVTRQRLTMRWDAELLRAVSWCAQAESSLVQVSDRAGGQPLAIFYARHVGLQDPGRFARPGRVAAIGLTQCRSAPMVDAGMAFADGLDERDRREACRAFERAVRGRAGAAAHPVVYRWVPAPLLGSVPARGRRLLPQGPTMVIDNSWSDLSGYLAGLPGSWPSRLERIHSEVSSGDPVRVEVVDAVDPAQAAWLADTVRRRRRRGPVPFPPVPAAYFARLNQIPGFRYLTYRDRDGRLLAALVVYDDGEDLHSGIWGYRAEAEGGRRNLYFDIYPRQVEMMIRLGRRRLRLGPAMEDVKVQLGARPEPRWALVGLGPARGDSGDAPWRPPPVTTAAARADRHSRLVRLARRLSDGKVRKGRRKGGRSVRPELAMACPQCGVWSSVPATRPGAHPARYWCPRCGAVAPADPAGLMPVARLRRLAAPGVRGGPYEVLPAPMVEWVRSWSKRPLTLQRLEKATISHLYRAWDTHLAGLSTAERAELAGPAGPAPVAGLPRFSTVVKAVNATCYHGELALRRLAGADATGPKDFRQAVWERVEHARRWLALRGGDDCWIRQVPESGLVPADPAAVARVVQVLRAGGRPEPGQRAVVLAALFGTSRGPRISDLLGTYGADGVLAGLEAYLGSGQRPLRGEALARLAAPAEPAAG